MTNQEQYKRVFDAVASSKMRKLEASEIMESRKKGFNIKGLAIAMAAVILVIGACGAAYATDLGGIQSKVQLWLRGELTDVTLEIASNGSGSEYALTYTDADGNQKEIHGGGIATDMFGRERPLTEDEILEQLSQPEVVYEDDGTVWVYYGSEKVEITDMFDADGVCYVKLTGGKKPIYMTVQYQQGWSTSNNRFLDP